MTLKEKILETLEHATQSYTTRGVVYYVARRQPDAEPAPRIDSVRRALYALEEEGLVESSGSSSRYRWRYVTASMRAIKDTEKADGAAREAVADRLIGLLHASVASTGTGVQIRLTVRQAEELADLLQND